MPDLYVYHLTEHELNLSRNDAKEAEDVFGKDTPEFCECMIARQKVWCNLIVNDFQEYQDIRDRCGRPLFDYETRESCHEGAVHGLIKWQNRLIQAQRHRAKKKAKKVKAGEA